MKDSELFYLEERRQKEKIFLEFFVFVFLVLLRVFGLLLFCSLGLFSVSCFVPFLFWFTLWFADFLAVLFSLFSVCFLQKKKKKKKKKKKF